MIVRSRSENGIALVLSLFLMLAMSVIAGSLMFLSQTETYASMNYRLMSQARYAAESGVHKATNYLMSAAYVPPATDAELAVYDLTKSPVVLVASPTQPVVLSASGSMTGHYPVTATQAAYALAGTGSLVAGSTTMTYDTYAKLVGMRQIAVYGSTVPATVQTWEIVSNGTIVAGSRTAQVEVTAMLERQIGPAFNYAAFAVFSGCDALGFSGGGSTDSYDSTNALVGGHPVTATYGGNVGTNGNLTEVGNTTVINGSLSTPRTGVGTCSAAAVSAAEISGGATVNHGMITLPQPIPAPLPALPSPMPPLTSMNFNSNCSDFNVAQCSVVMGNVTLTPVGTTPLQLGNVTLNGGPGTQLHLRAGTYNINSLSFNGNSKVVIDSGPVILNVAGRDAAGGDLATPIDFEGQMASNSTYDPTMLQIRYAGTGTIKATGGSDNAALVYAPNANVNILGGADWYGALVAKTFDVSGGAAIHYDRHLQKSELMLGNFGVSSFSWKKF
jgi:Tfp pilus assembly protein PilX